MTLSGLYIRAGSRRSSPASLPGFTGYLLLNMSSRWTHNRLFTFRRWTHNRLSTFHKLQLLKNLKKMQTLFSVFMWCHSGHVNVQNNSGDRLLGTWFYYYAKLEQHFAIVLYTNMAISSHEWKPAFSKYLNFTIILLLLIKHPVSDHTLRWYTTIPVLSKSSFTNTKWGRTESILIPTPSCWSFISLSWKKNWEEDWLSASTTSMNNAAKIIHYHNKDEKSMAKSSRHSMFTNKS